MLKLDKAAGEVSRANRGGVEPLDQLVSSPTNSRSSLSFFHFLILSQLGEGNKLIC